MNIACGTDIIEVKRIEKAIKTKKDKFLKEIYTEKEIKYCESKNIMKYESYAARFAGKEAVLKATSNFLDSKYDINWLDIEILNNSQGRPYVILNSNKIKANIEIDISLSHIKEYAIANCIIQICE